MRYRVLIDEQQRIPYSCLIIEYSEFTVHQKIPIDIFTCLGDLIAAFVLDELGYHKVHNIPLFLGHKYTARQQSEYLSFELNARNDMLRFCELEQPISTQLFDLICNTNFAKFSLHVSIRADKDSSPMRAVYPFDDRFEQFSNADKLHYSYDCSDIWSVAYVIMHYLVHHHYSFVKCAHCGKYFATDNQRNKYCRRISPISTVHTCKEEVENAAARCKAAKNRIQKRLYKDGLALIDESQRTAYYDFLNSCDRFQEEIKNCASYTNICAYENYLKQFSIRKRGRTTKE